MRLPDTTDAAVARAMRDDAELDRMLGDAAASLRPVLRPIAWDDLAADAARERDERDAAWTASHARLVQQLRARDEERDGTAQPQNPAARKPVRTRPASGDSLAGDES